MLAAPDLCAQELSADSTAVSAAADKKNNREKGKKDEVKKSREKKDKKAKNIYEKADIYMFGTSFSFSDSIMYMTEVQKIDSVMVRADYFLDYQDDYDTQFKKWLENGGASMQVSSSQFFKKKSDADRKYSKVRKSAVKKHRCTIITVPDFKYTRIQ